MAGKQHSEAAELLMQRDELIQRLVKALLKEPTYRKLAIVTSWLSIDAMRELVNFLENR